MTPVGAQTGVIAGRSAQELAATFPNSNTDSFGPYLLHLERKEDHR